MLPGPIFFIDMITTARRARHYVIRVIYAGILLLLLYGNYYDAYGTRSYNLHEVAQLSQSFFYGFVLLQLLVVMVLAPALVAGTVSLERERRTIEYLFATDLSNAEIVLGRLAARMLLIGSDVLVGLPILALTMLFGGVALERLLIVFALTLSTALFIASLSLAVSVGTAKARDAVLRSYAILVGLMLLPMFVGEFLFRWLFRSVGIDSVPEWIGEVVGWFEALNPLQSVLGTLFANNLGWGDIQRTVVCQSVFAAGCAAAAVALVRRIHLRAAGETKRPRLAWLRSNWRERREVGDEPMRWKELYAPQAKVRLGFFARLSLLMLGLAALASCVGQLVAFNSPYSPGSAAPAMFFQSVTPLVDFIVCCGSLAIAARAATCITTERERECWDSLVSTPLEATEIVWAKIGGSLYAARGLVGFVALLWGLALVVDLRLLPRVLACLATTFVVLFFGCTLGVFFSAAGKSSLRAMGNTLGALLFIGGGYLFCCIPLAFAGSSQEWALVLAPCVPFLLAFPAIDFERRLMNGHEIELAAYSLGMIGYTVAGVCMALAAARRIRPFEDADDAPSRVAAQRQPVPTVPPDATPPAAAESPANALSVPGPRAAQSQAGDAKSD
jgi:ABC-type transport system involved in multi-copper enzyme maturation permease subunit